MDAPLCRHCDTRHWSRQPCKGSVTPPSRARDDSAQTVTQNVTNSAQPAVRVTRGVTRATPGPTAVTPAVTLDSLAAEVNALRARVEALERKAPKTSAERMRELRARKKA